MSWQARALVVLLVCLVSFPLMHERAFSLSPVYVTVELSALPPLSDLNSSVYGLEVPAAPSAVGDNFTVALHLDNATLANVPRGVNGIEVHFSFGNILNYAVPTEFVNFLGAAGGVLIAPLFYGVGPGFFASDGTTKVSNPPYAGAAMYKVAAASSGGVWNGEDGLVANVTFQIVRQPLANESSVSLPLVCQYAEFDTSTVNPNTGEILTVQVYPDAVSGNLMLDGTNKPPVYYTLAVQENPAGSGTVDVKVGGVVQTAPYVFTNGTLVEVGAMANGGYDFSSWSLDGVDIGSADPYSLAMTRNHTVTANFVMAVAPPPLLPVTLTAEPTAVPPLVDVDSSVYGLECPPSQVAVGDMFTMGLHLRNATRGNVPVGVRSIKVHFVFGNISGFLRPLSFLNEFGAPNGVLNPDIRFSVMPGFYDVYGNVAVYPYAGAVSFDVAASSTGAGWNGVDGLVAVLTFEIVGQPQFSLGEGNVTYLMDYASASLADFKGGNVLFDSLNATVALDTVCHDVAVTNVTLLKTVVGLGYILGVNVTVANHGSVAEDFALTVYANASVFDSRMVSLGVEGLAVVVFLRNITWFAEGRYVVKAVTGPVAGENTTDSAVVVGSVTVTIPGDVNGDGIVGLVDLVHLVIAYGSRAGQPKWNPNADVNGDGVVDLFDMSVLAQNYGQHYP